MLKLPETLMGTKMCLDNSLCGWSVTIFLLLTVPIPVLWSYEKIRPIVQRLKLKNENAFSLAQSKEKRDGIIFLELCNRYEKPNVAVNQIEIGDKDKIFSKRNDRFYIDKGKCENIAFIKVSEFFKYYSIVDDIKETDFDQFREKKKVFDISVNYGNGLLQWFRVTVIYTEPSQIELEISNG